MVRYNTSLGYCTMFPGSCCFGGLCTALCCGPCFLSSNMKWQAHAQHIGLTIDGIKFVKDKRQTCCGLACQDAGKESKTVPYDKLTDCDVQEPAGAACCCITRTLATVNVDTASSGGVDPNSGATRHELSIVGLKVRARPDPPPPLQLLLRVCRLSVYPAASMRAACGRRLTPPCPSFPPPSTPSAQAPLEFKRAVWDMKRRQQGISMGVTAESVGGAAILAAPKAEGMARDGLAGDANAPLLMEIRDELRALHATMRAKA
jgi:hypothetical protein